MKFGLRLVFLQRSISARQISIVFWSRPASSRTPQRRSIAWNRAPCSSHSLASFGKTSRWSAFRSSFRSSNVELTKTRKVRVAIGTLPPDDAQTGLRHDTRPRRDGAAIITLHFVRQLAPWDQVWTELLRGVPLGVIVPAALETFNYPAAVLHLCQPFDLLRAERDRRR